MANRTWMFFPGGLGCVCECTERSSRETNGAYSAMTGKHHLHESFVGYNQLLFLKLSKF